MSTELILVRLVELFFTVGWLFGFYLCWAKTRKAYLLGAYVGISLTWGFDWLFAQHLWNMDFAPGTIMMSEWVGHGEALWAPISYGAFFGIAMFYWLRYESAIEKTLGVWRYPLIFPVMFVANIIFEGLIIEYTHCNTYHLPEEYLILNIPWMHLVTTGGMAFGVIILSSLAVSLFRDAGWDEFDLQAAPSGVSAGWRWKLFWIGVALPQAAFYFSLLVGMYMYEAMGLMKMGLMK